MNKRDVIFAIFMGLGSGFLMLRSIEPREERVVLRPDSEGGYHPSTGKDDIRVDVIEFPNGVLQVTIDPSRKKDHYLWAACFAFLYGTFQFQSMKKAAARKKEEEKDELSFSSNPHRHKDPLYEEFLQEDANRRLFPRPYLEEDFKAWKLDRDSDGETSA